MIDTNELRRLAQAATPGPWMIDYVGVGFEVAAGESVIAQSQQIQGDMRHKARKANAAFIAAANPAAISELLDRLEAAEKAVTEAYRRGYATGQEEIAAELEFAKREVANLHDDIHELTDERDALRAKVAEMERQEPVAWIRERDDHRRRKLSFEKPVKSSPDKLHWSPLVYLPGAQPAPSIHEVTDAMALAFHAALTDGSIGEHEMEEIKAGLRAALAAAPEAKP